MQDPDEDRYPTDMGGLLHAVNGAHSSLEAVLEGRTERDLIELRDAGGWSVKDHLNHLAVWERGVRYLLRRKPIYAGMGLDERSYRELDPDGQNAVIFERTRDLALSDVLDRFRQENQALIQQISSMTWDDLQKPFSAYAPDEPEEMRDQPVLYWLLDETAGHRELHQEWIEEILLRSDPDSD